MNDNGTDWRNEAACRGLRPALFFAARGDHEAIAAAKATCARCPVIEPCLDHALLTRVPGVWGGTTDRERRGIRRRRRAGT